MSTETNDEIPHVNLDDLIKPVATVTLGGKKYSVLPVHGEARLIFEQIARETKSGKEFTGQRYTELAQRIIFSVAPKIPRALVLAMANEQLTAIAGLAMGAEAKVRDVIATAAKKDGGPAKQRTRSGRK